MENNNKGGNTWRRNQNQISSSNPYRRTSNMPQDTGVSNNYSNHVGQPSYQVSRMPQSTWYGTQSNLEPSSNADTWNWGIEPQQNPGQYFQETYPTGVHQNYPQQIQSQQHPEYPVYDYYNTMPAQRLGQQDQNNSSNHQYDESNEWTSATVGNTAGNGSGDPWNWGIGEDAQANAGDWGENEKAWNWAIPGADTPNSVPTPVETPAPLPQRLTQGGVDEMCQPAVSSLENSSAQIKPNVTPPDEEKTVETAAPPPQRFPQGGAEEIYQPPSSSRESSSVPKTENEPLLVNQPTTDEGKAAPPISSMVSSQVVPKIEEVNSTVVISDPIMDIEGGASWEGWIDHSTEPVIKQEETKDTFNTREQGEKAEIREEKTKTPEPVTKQDDALQGTTEQSPQTQESVPPVQINEELPPSSTVELNHQQSQIIPELSENLGQLGENRQNELIRSEVIQEFTLEQHTDANHNELLLLQVNQQLNEGTQSFDQWWTPDRNVSIPSNLDGAQQQILVVESETSIVSVDVNQSKSADSNPEPMDKREGLPAQSLHSQESQWSKQLEGNGISQLADDLASFSISSKREMGEGTPADEEPASNVVSPGDISSAKDQHHPKVIPEDGANLETLPDNKERLDDEEPANKFPNHSEREAAVSWPQRVMQPDNQEVAPPKVEVVPSSNSSFVQWQPGVRQRTQDEGSQESRSVAQQRSLGMAARKGAPSPRPTVGLSSRSNVMLGSRDENRAPRPKYLQSRASPSPSNVSQQQSTIGSMPISQQRPQPIRRSNDDTPLPSDRNQYLETGQLRDEEDEEDEDPCGPPSNQRPPPGLRRMVPGESSSPEAGGASVSSLPVAVPDGMVDDDDDDAMDAVAIPSGPRVVPGVAEGEEENTRNDGVGQVPDSSLTSSANMSSGPVQTVTEVPNAERSETIGSEGGALPSIMTTHARDSVEDRRGSYSRVDVRRDVSSERERSVKAQPSRGSDNVSVPHIVGGESGEEDREEGKDGDRGKGRHSRRRGGRGMRDKEREEGELSDDDDADDMSGRRSVDDRHGETESGRSRRRDHGRGYSSKKGDRHGHRDEGDSGDDRVDDRGSRDDARRDDKRRRDRGYDDQWSRHSRRGYHPDAEPDDDYYRGHHRRRGSNEWDSRRQHSVPPEERGHPDDRGSRHDYPSQDWSRDHRHREWGPEDEYSRDYYNLRHPNSVSGRPPQGYYRDGPRSRTNSQLDLGGNGYEGRPGSRGGEGYYSDTNRDTGWERRNRGPERSGARLRRDSGERDSGEWHEREHRTPRSHYPHQYHSHRLHPEPPYYGIDPRFPPDSRQFSPYSPGYDYYGHPLPPSQGSHPYYNDPYRMRDPYGQAYLYYDEMRRTRPVEYAEWYRKTYGRSTGPHPVVAGGTATPGRRTPSASGGGPSPVNPRSDAGGEGGHSLEDAALGDDSRGSVHSGRSSLNLLASNMDDDSASGQKLGADRSLGSPYRGIEQISSRESTPQRLTPAKFPSAHIKGVLTGHGSLLLLKPNPLMEGPSTTVEFLSLREFLKNDPMVAELEGFPGPLIRGPTHKNSVIQFCNSKINAAVNDMSIQDRESYILLWKLLILLLKQNGSVVGTDISSLLLEDSAYLQNTTCDSAPVSVSPQLIPEELSSNSNLTTPDEGIVAGAPYQTLGNRLPQLSEDYLTRKFREYLLFGNTKDALEWAMKHGLWGHAMFLAHKIGGRMLASVLTRFANNLPHNDPLQTLYQLLSGKQPAAITSCSDEKWGDWRPHLAMIISNSSNHPDLQRKSIITLGDTLANRGCLFASQFCYVIATLNMGSASGTPSLSIQEMNAMFSGPEARHIILGSAMPLTHELEAKIPNEVVHCTEVLEYAMCLADPNFCIPYFQPVKLEYALRLVEHGMVQEGLQYFEAVSTKVTSWLTLGGVDKSIDIYFLKRLALISDRLKHQDPVLERSETGVVVDPQWLQQLNSCIKILEGQPNGMAAGFQQMNTVDPAMYANQATMDVQQGSMPYGMASAEGATTAQTDISGQGVTQSAEYKAQWNNFYYEQAKWQQQQQQMTHPSQSDATISSPDLVTSPAVETSHMTSPYAGNVWDPMNQNSMGNAMVNDINMNDEVKDDRHHQEPQNITAAQDLNTAFVENTGQPSSEPMSDSGTNSYWDIATSNDQTVSCLSGEEEEEEDNDDDDEDEEESEEEEGDYEDEQPRKDVSGRQRQLSESNSSVRNWRSTEASQKAKKESSEGKGGGIGGPSNAAGSGGGWLGGLLSKLSLRPKNQMNLPDDKNPSIVWDSDKKQWVNMDAEEDEAATELKPPPKASELIPTIAQPTTMMNSVPQNVEKSVPENNALNAPMATAPGFGNIYKLPKGRKMRQNYVDVMGNSTTKAANRGTMPPPLSLFPQPAAPPPAGNFFIPAPVQDDSAPTDFLTSASTAENEVQESSEMSRSSSMSSLSREVQGFMLPDKRGHGNMVDHRPLTSGKNTIYQGNQYHQQSNLHYQ